MGEVSFLEAQPFTPEAWGPFGWVPVPDTDRRDGVHGLEFEWGDPHLNFIAHAPDEVERTADGLAVDRLYRHDTHTQALMLVNCDAVMAVAPAATAFSDRADLEALRAFVLQPLDVLVLHRGTWHWGPFPLGDEPLRMLNVQGRRYLEDNTGVDLAEKLGVRVVVRTP